MSDEVRLDPEALRQGSADLTELSDRVGRTHALLRHGELDAEGYWGSDDLGAAFARDFTPHFDQLLANIQALQQSLRATGEHIANAANDFVSQDLEGAHRIRRAAEEPSTFENGTQRQPHSAAARPVPPGRQGAPENRSVTTASVPVAADAGAQAPAVSDPGPLSRSATPQARPVGPVAAQKPAAADPRMQRPDLPRSSTPAGDPGRRPRPAEVAPSQPKVTSPPTGRDVPRIAPTAGSSVTPARDPRYVGGANRATPWAEPPSRVPRGSASSDQPPASPRSDVPSRSPQAGQQRNPAQRRKRERPTGGRRASPVLAWLVRALADRHSVAVVGFDLQGLQETPVRQFVAAVDRVLTDYPMIELDVVSVAELGDDTTVQWQREWRDSTTVRSITLDRRVACSLHGDTETEPAGTGFDDMAIYRATLGELGLALNDAGGGVACKSAQRTLVTAYFREVAGRYTTLAELLGGYRRWRAELFSATDEHGGFDTRRALGGAFADVVLNGAQATAPAKALHGALVDAATLSAGRRE
ncbi:hypothetical protein [Nocardia sp. NPDC049149]|uniref:hypothetical protein n=1 Tax=Nocardia sp. NPDC049149 TaxID=3364315 RepID=UPI00371ACA56